MSEHAYRGERRLGGQLVYDTEGEPLDKALDVVSIAPGGFDWGSDADTKKLLQLAVALLADHVDAATARRHHHGFAQYLADTLDGDEWMVPVDAIEASAWTRPTTFENRAPAVDETAGTEATQSGADSGESATATATGDGPSTATTGDSTATDTALSVIATKVVNEAIEAADVALDPERPEPAEELVGTLRAKIGLGAVKHDVDRDALQTAAFAEFERQRERPTGGDTDDSTTAGGGATGDAPDEGATAGNSPSPTTDGGRPQQEDAPNTASTDTPNQGADLGGPPEDSAGPSATDAAESAAQPLGASDDTSACSAFEWLSAEDLVTPSTG